MKIPFLLFFFIGGVIAMASMANPLDQLSRIQVVLGDSSWTPVQATGSESGLKFWTANAKDKKTQLGWLTPNNEDCKLWENKLLYDKNKNNNLILDNENKEIPLKCINKQCVVNGTPKNCYFISLTTDQAVNIDEFIKLGENSFYTVYQNSSKVIFDAGGFDITATIYKKVGEEFVLAPNELFVNFEEGKWKHSAYDEYCGDWCNYKFVYETDADIIKHGSRINFKQGENSYWVLPYATEEGICNQYNTEVLQEDKTINQDGDTITLIAGTEVILNSSDCKFNFYSQGGKNYYEIDFWADGNIDPIIEGDTSYTSTDTNITQETGSAHLNITTDSPYDSLVGYWSMDIDDDTNSFDYTKENNDGTYVNSETVENCYFEKCYNGNGGDDEIVVAYDDSLNLTGDGTIMAWIKITETNTQYNGLIAKTPVTSGINSASDYFLILEPNNKLRGGITGHNLNPGIELNEDQWYHVGLMWNSTDVNLIQDGVVIATTARTGNPLGTNQETFIGSRDDRGFLGNMDEVMIFNTALTETQIINIMNNQSVRFLETGEMLFENLDLGTNDTARVSLTEYGNPFNSSIQVKFDDTSYSTFDSDGIASVDVSGVSDTTDMNMTLKFTAGNETGNPFISPTIKGNITVDGYIGGVPQLQVELYNPIINTDVAHNQTFTFEVNVTCVQGNCLNISVYLDPTVETWLYQEDNNGSYIDANWFGGGSELEDGDYGTPDYANWGTTAYYYPNYTKPADSTSNSLWTIGYEFNNPVNKSIPSDCWNAYSDKLSFLIISEYIPSISSTYNCWTGTAWYQIYSHSNKFVYEDAMQWSIDTGIKSGLISTVEGDTPFYTTDNNPQNISLDAGESMLVSWSVNATGEIGLTHTFFAYANVTRAEDLNDVSSTVEITIVDFLPINPSIILFIKPNQLNTVPYVRLNESLIFDPVPNIRLGYNQTIQ